MNNPLQMPNDPKAMESLFINPIVRKVKDIDEKDGTAASYRGITKKTAFFLLLVLAGAAVAILIHMIPFQGIVDDNGIAVSYIELGVLAVSVAMMIVCPILAIFIKKTTPVTGSLSCIANGCVLGIIGVFLDEFRGAMLLAFVLTFAVVAVMLFVYFSGKVNINKKFKVVVGTLFGTMIVGSIMVGLSGILPGFGAIYSFVQGNPLLSLLCSLGGVLIACLFLLMDFDTVRETVDNKLPKKYEWVAAYSIAFTVLWIYFKILDLIMMAQRAQKSN